VKGTILRPFADVGLAEGSLVLTFDDGPVGEGKTEGLLDVLGEAGIKAAFCVIGSQVQRHPETCLRMRREGHLLVNHSHTHVHPMALSEEELLADLARCDRAIADAIGEPGFRSGWYRPPGGVWTRTLERVLRRAGKSLYPITHFAWDVFPGMDRWNRRRLPASIQGNWERSGGGIYLLHEAIHPLTGRREDVAPRDACPWLLPVVRDIIASARRHGLAIADPDVCPAG
jgi:peptidoglycan/xylan/chitin deacetylase (PgdA/CDA1 family)